MNIKYAIAAMACISTLAGCVSPPTRPSVMVLPGTGKTYQQFRYDEMNCRSEAENSTNGGAQAANNSAVNTAAAGTLIGAAAGALIGAASGRAGAGAAIGAGGGLLVGSSVASNSGAMSGGDLQDQFDTIYTQCMYAKGNRVPVSGSFSQTDSDQGAPPDYYSNTGDKCTPDYNPNNSVGSGTPPDYVPR